MCVVRSVAIPPPAHDDDKGIGSRVWCLCVVRLVAIPLADGNVWFYCQLEQAVGERDAARYELAGLGQQVEHLRGERDAHAQEVTSLKIRAGDEVASLRIWTERQVASLRKSAEVVVGMARSGEMQVASLENRHAEEVASLRQKLVDGLASANAGRAEEVASLDLALEGLRDRLASAEDQLANARLQAGRFEAEVAEVRGERDRLASAVMQAMDGGGGECTRCRWLEGEGERAEKCLGGAMARLGVAEAMLKVTKPETSMNPCTPTNAPPPNPEPL